MRRILGSANLILFLQPLHLLPEVLAREKTRGERESSGAEKGDSGSLRFMRRVDGDGDWFVVEVDIVRFWRFRNVKTAR